MKNINCLYVWSLIFFLLWSGCTKEADPTPAGMVSTLAGSSSGFTDGMDTAAQFKRPMGVAVDVSGNVYVADYGNSRIRKISSKGVVTTLAGSGIDGFADGIGTEAQFSFPTGVAVDVSGNVYVADYGNNRIRKIDYKGVVTTVAGNGMSGSTDGTGTTAEFFSPSAVAVDARGNVYVADYNNQLIRKITPSGLVTTLAGSGAEGFANGMGTNAQFSFPTTVAVDVSGQVYVADGNHRIRKISSEGVVTTLAGSGTDGFTDGIGTEAQFSFPYGVAVDASGQVYVADYGNNRIRRITSAGVVSTVAGCGAKGSANGPITTAEFFNPTAVAVDASGKVYVADYRNHLIRKIQ